jgi:uncharacterized protein
MKLGVYTFSDKDITTAVRHGRLDLLKWILDRSNTVTSPFQSEYRNNATVPYIKQGNTAYLTRIAAKAAKYNNIPILEWALQNVTGHGKCEETQQIRRA